LIIIFCFVLLAHISATIPGLAGSLEDHVWGEGMAEVREAACWSRYCSWQL